MVRWQEARNEVKLEGTTICPGIGVGRVRVLDRELVIPRNRIPAGQVQWEQQRYSEAVKTVGGHLREHIEEDHHTARGEQKSLSQVPGGRCEGFSGKSPVGG